jgi:hypothetical protein
MPSANLRISIERGLAQAEQWVVTACCTAASMIAIVWSWRHDAMLNYGDAVAHLHIARRVFDARTPRFSQLGSVWLPLPHILLIPFVQDYQWWATGLAGVIPSALAYIAACAGLYRLARRFACRAAAALSLAIFALNPSLLYLQTTAMTEPLFLCETIWIIVLLVEWHEALGSESDPYSGDVIAHLAAAARSTTPIASSIQQSLRVTDAAIPRRRGAWLQNPSERPAPKPGIFSSRSSRFQAGIAAVLVAAVFTRYDGWIIACIAWTGIGLALWAHRRLGSPAYWLPGIAVAAAPILWFVYNSVCFGDWLYFARGPFSAKAIELRTAAHGAGPLHPGWHNLWVSLLFYLKVSQLDSIAAAAHGNLIANALLAVAALGTVAACLAEMSHASRRAIRWILLLWLPVPFYAWSVAYGSVPIFFPVWWPYTLYNTRYGLELLPALALGLGFAAEFFVRAFRQPRFTLFASRLFNRVTLGPLLTGLVFTVCFAFAAINQVELLHAGPLVYVESTKNLAARLPYDEAIPPVLDDLLSFEPHAPILMDTSAYPEIVALAGIPLRQTINESDLEIFRAALAAPATDAAIIVTYAGDDIDKAVKAHPENLAVAARFTANTQPAATIYFSTKWMNQSPLLKAPSGLDPLLKNMSPPAREIPQNSTSP